jgi:tRNA pseudouridine38-40 synthase
MRYALKFSYDGKKFNGYARQPDKETVEGSIFQVMESLKIDTSTIRTASRTDKGVSAQANVLNVETSREPRELLQALNSQLDGIIFHGSARVDKNFNPRHAKQRWYRYCLPHDDGLDLEELNQKAALFEGEHDFRGFSKKDTGNENTVLSIDSFNVHRDVDLIIFDIRAQRFLWQMVRRVVSATLNMTGEEITNALAEAQDAGLKPMPAENLVLMDIIFDLDFEIQKADISFLERGSIKNPMDNAQQEMTDGPDC